MAKKIEKGEEYKLLKQTPLPKKIARVFAIVWVLGVICPLGYVFYQNAAVLKEFAVVKIVALTGDKLTENYQELVNETVSRIDIEKYTAQINIPEINIDQLNTTTQHVQTGAQVLKKLGVKNMDKVSDTSAAVQTQVNKINDDLRAWVAQSKALLTKNISAALTAEAQKLGDKQVQKELHLTDTAFQALTTNAYGFLSENERAATHLIYAQLKKAPLLTNILTPLDKWFVYISWGVLALSVLILLVPVFILFKLAKKFSANFAQCPYCNKVFLTKAGGINIFKTFSGK